MDFRLKIEPKYFLEDGSGRRRFSFAVVDLDRSESYPQNFVCLLPLRIDPREKTGTAFQKIFGEKSVEQAKALLTQALEVEDDSEIRAEIERRLNLLKPKTVSIVKCTNCGKPVYAGGSRKFGPRLCRECWLKRYRNRK